MEQYNYTKYICEYVFNGEKYGLTIPAKSWEEAEKRLKEIGKGNVLGIETVTIHYKLGWIAKILVWLKNLFYKPSNPY